MKKIIIIIVIIAILFLIYNAVFINSNIIKVEAASAFYPFSLSLMQNIYEKEDIVKLVSTSQAYNDVIKGKADIVIATAPSDEQQEMIKKSNVDLEYKFLYYEPLVIYLNSENRTDNLSIEEIKDIYYNDKDNWNSYQLEKNNGSQTCFESIVNNNIINKNHVEIHTMPEIIDRVAEDKKGIGYAFNSYYSNMHINENTKAIKVNGKSPEDIDYPLLFEVYMIYRKDNNNEDISKIVNWIDSEEGQEFIINNNQK